MRFVARNMGRTAVALMVMVVTVARCLAAAPPRGSEKAKARDQDKIQGTWKFGSVRDQGREQPIPEGNRVVITPGVLKIVYPTKDDPMGWRYTIDPSKDPKEMDWVVEIDPGHPIRQLAIYSLDGDTLRICSAAAGKPRPATFESKEGDFGEVWVLKRVAAPTTK